MEREILEAMIKNNVSTIVRMYINNFIEPVNFLKTMKPYIRNKIIIVVLPPESNDEVLALLKLWIMRDFPNALIIAYRSYFLDKDEVLLGF